MSRKTKKKVPAKKAHPESPGGNAAIFIAGFILILTAWLITRLYLMNEIKETNYRVEAIRKNITRIQQSILEVENDIAKLSRADRIRWIAEHELNLVNSKPEIKVIILE